MPVTLEPILPHIPAFLMVLFRLTGLFIFAPMLGSTAIPARVKVLLALVLAFCIYPIIPPQAPMQLSVASMAGGVGAELVIGLVIGWGASLPLMAMQMGGLIMGQQFGIDVGQLFNPDIGDQTSPLSQFYFLFAVAIFVLLDGHHVMIAALTDTFASVPLGAWTGGHDVLATATGMLAAMFDFGFRVAAPFLGLVFLESIAIGFIIRTVPQINILSLGFPVRILLGFGILIATAGVVGHELAGYINDTLRHLFTIFTG